MTPEECRGCRYFDGVDNCEVEGFQSPKGLVVFPQPIDGIVACFAKIEGARE